MTEPCQGIVKGRNSRRVKVDQRKVLSLEGLLGSKQQNDSCDLGQQIPLILSVLVLLF